VESTEKAGREIVMKKHLIGLVMGLAALGACVSPALAELKGIDNPLNAPYYNALKGKKVIFVPMSMSFDLTQGWAAAMEKQAKQLGYGFEIRDPNWSGDAGTRILQQVLNDKPDVLVVHNPDPQTYARLLPKIEKEGVKIVQINMASSYRTDVFVGADWVEIGRRGAQALVDRCSPGKGPSTKVALMEGDPIGAANVYQLRGFSEVMAKHPDIQVVADQAADYDPAKAHSITLTVLKQNPDLCGIFGIWDGQDVGIGGALQESGKQGQVFLVTSGGGGRQYDCDNLRKGLFSMVLSYDVPTQGAQLNLSIARLLQSKEKAGADKITYFSPLTELTKDNLTDRNCWAVGDLK
jgi:ribose transport system substrate-binding protein